MLIYFFSDLSINHGTVQYINTCEIITENINKYSNENSIAIKLASYEANNNYIQKKKHGYIYQQ